MSVPNQRTLGEAFSAPGIDPREWVSYGTVADEEPVSFESGLGPLVSVVLQPSKVPVRCRVPMQSAGNGEAEYVPFVAGDEVLVVIPEGHAWSGPCIVGKLCNNVNPYPSASVAGQDPTKNNFSFKRSRTAWVHEVEGGYLVRDAMSSAFMQLDGASGNVTLRDGSGGALQLTSSGVTYQDAGATKILQLDADAGRFRAQVDDALLLLASGGQGSTITVPGSLSMSTAAQPAAEHVTTTEAVVNIVTQILAAFAAANVGPLTGATLTSYLLAGTHAAGVTAAAVAPLHPLVAEAIQTAFSLATQKPPGVPGLGQSLPGIGCVGLIAG